MKGDFPIFQKRANLVFLDTAASAQKPQVVIDSIAQFYSEDYANIHRGNYPLSEIASRRFEESRVSIAKLIGAKSNELVFCKNTTEALNLVAHSLHRSGIIKKGDEIILSPTEHHSNLIPWLMLEKYSGVKIKYLEINESGEITIDRIDDMVSDRTKIIALSHVSNVNGKQNDIKKVIQIARKNGALTVIDGAQAVAHINVDIKDIDCDFYAFSAHKMYGPSGIGAIYMKEDIINKLEPMLGGGGIVTEVSLDDYQLKNGIQRFEAGTPAIAEAIGFATATEYLLNIGFKQITKHDQELVEYAHIELSKIKEIKLFSNEKSIGICSFTVDGVSDFDIADELGEREICVRVGKHCAHPFVDKLGANTIIRASFGIYNKKADIDKLSTALREIISKLS